MGNEFLYSIPYLFLSQESSRSLHVLNDLIIDLLAKYWTPKETSNSNSNSSNKRKHLNLNKKNGKYANSQLALLCILYDVYY